MIEHSSEAEAKECETLEGNTHDKILANCEEYLQQSKLERTEIATRSLKVSKGFCQKKIDKSKRNHHNQTEGINESEFKRRKAAGKCECCA